MTRNGQLNSLRVGNRVFSALHRFEVEEVTAAGFSSDGTQLAFASALGAVTLIDCAGFEKLCEFDSGLRNARSLKMSMQSKLVVVATGSELALWSWENAEPRCLWQKSLTDTHLGDVDFSQDGASILAVRNPGGLTRFPTRAGRPELPWENIRGPLLSFASSPDGKWTYFVDGSLRIMRAGSSGDTEDTGIAGLASGVAAMDIAVDGRELFLGTVDGQILIADVQLKTLGPADVVGWSDATALRFEDNSHRLLAGNRRGRLYALSLEDGHGNASGDVLGSPMNRIDLIREGGRSCALVLGAGGAYSVVTLDGQFTRLVSGQLKDLGSPPAFRSGNRRLVGLQGPVLCEFSLSNVEDIQILAKLDGDYRDVHLSESAGIAVLPDFRKEELTLVDLNSGGVEKRRLSRPGAFCAVQVSSSGKLIAVANERSEIVVLRLSPYEEVCSLSVAQGTPTCLAFSNRDSLVCAGFADGRVSLCSLESGRVLVDFHAQAESIQALSFNSDDSQFASASRDQTIVLWPVSAR